VLNITSQIEELEVRVRVRVRVKMVEKYDSVDSDKISF
jgi:hypothetical protein